MRLYIYAFSGDCMPVYWLLKYSSINAAASRTHDRKTSKGTVSVLIISTKRIVSVI